MLLAAKCAMWVAVGLFVAMLALEPAVGRAAYALLAVAGIAILLRGGLMLLRPAEVLQPLAEAEERSLIGRLGFRSQTVFGAIMLLLIGAGWFAMGLLAATGAVR